MAKTIVIVGTLDTKGEEVKYLKECIEKRGHSVIVIDIGILGEPYIEPDIGREEVARGGGGSLDDAIGFHDERKAIMMMAEGALRISKKLLSDGDLDGILSIGGSTGGSAGLTVMRGLPSGIPKLFLSALGLSFIRPELTASDIAIMPSIGDLWGMNRITKGVLDKASGAISGMAENYVPEMDVSRQPVIGVTTLGTAGFRYVPFLKSALEERGHEAVIFTAMLEDTESLKNLIEQDQISGVLGLCLVEFTNRACNSNVWGFGIERIKIAAEMGIPLVVSPGAIDFFQWIGSSDKLPPKYKGRQVHVHNALVCLIKTSQEEKIAVAKDLAEDLNKAKKQVAVIIPSQGFSEYDKKGGIFCDTDGRNAFIETLKKCLRPEVRVIDLDIHINDSQFAIKAAELIDAFIGAKG